MQHSYRARYIVTPQGVLTDACLTVNGGRIVDLGPAESTRDLGDVALVPGLVNAHSHAFQRLIRGRTEHLSAGRKDDDFWSWRTQMYGAALALSPDQVDAVARMTFLEMVQSGITAVGEFHYLHHRPDGAPYRDPNALAHQVIQAARAVGLRIALLRVAYTRGGFEREASPDQRRFIEPTVDVFLERADALEDAWCDDPFVTVGLAPHSIRAVPRDWLASIAEHAGGRVVHIHACEQRAELIQCMEEHGVTPIELLADVGLLGPETTLVHATHLDDDDVRRIAESGATVCACPTTERNLGDGFLPARALVSAGVPIALGSDSQAEIDLFSEARLVEYHARLKAERRNVLAPYVPSLRTADVLWPMATTGGAVALGLPTGALRVNAPADFVAIDLKHPALLGVDAESLISHLVFAATPACVRHVWVGGERIIEDRRHADEAAIQADYLEVRRTLTRR